MDIDNLEVIGFQRQRYSDTEGWDTDWETAYTLLDTPNPRFRERTLYASKPAVTFPVPFVVVEGKAVFAGDEVYDRVGNKFSVVSTHQHNDGIQLHGTSLVFKGGVSEMMSHCTWSKPLTRHYTWCTCSQCTQKSKVSY